MKPATAAALLLSFFLLASPSPAQTAPDIGSGPVSETIRREFLRAYYRGSFQNLTSLPPLGDVRRLDPSTHFDDVQLAGECGCGKRASLG